MTTSETLTARPSDLDSAEQPDADDVGLEAADTDESGDRAEPASITARVLAYVVDIVCPLGAITVCAVLGVWYAPGIWTRIACAAAAAGLTCVIFHNRIRVQGSTGRTWGRDLTGSRTGNLRHDRPVGLPRVALRELVRIVDSLPMLIVWLWPWRHRAGRTLADELAGTRVIAAGEIPEADRRLARRMAALSVATLALALSVLCSLQYVTDYRGDRAQAEITESAQSIAERSTIALLSYRPETVQTDLAAASAALTGSFKDYYTNYTANVVIPTAREESVTTQAQSVGTALVSADDREAVVLVYINQTTTTAQNPEPSVLASTVRVQLTKVGDQWLVAAFDPI